MPLRFAVALSALIGLGGCNLFGSTETVDDYDTSGSMDVSHASDGSQVDMGTGGGDDVGTLPDGAMPDTSNPTGDMSSTPDMTTLDMDCVPRSDQQICSNVSACGTLVGADDGCGGTRDVDCGGCASVAEGCYGNTCVCVETDEELCRRVSAACGSKTATDLCGASRTVDCGSCWFGESCAANACEIVTGGTDYYVATDGADTNPGTMAEPWRHIWHATEVIQAGDTAWVRGGTYTEVDAYFEHAGTAAAPIAIAAYPGETAVIDGDYGFWIDKSYIHVDGFVFRNTPGAVGGENASYVTVSNNVIENPSPHDTPEWAATGFNNLSFLRIIGNDFESWPADLLLYLEASDHVLIADNSFGSADDHAIHADNTSQIALMRNTFTNPIGGGAWFHPDGGTSDGHLIEGNVFDFTDWMAYYDNGTHSLVRRNQVTSTGELAFAFGSWDPGDRWEDGYFVHNTITDANFNNDYDGLAVWFGDDDNVDADFHGGLQVLNNVMWSNHETGDDEVFQLWVAVTASGPPYEPFGGIAVAGNLIDDSRASACASAISAGSLDSGDCPISVEESARADVAWFALNFGQRFFDNISADPLFTAFSPATRNFDLSLGASSPAVDAGVALTTTTAAGSGIDIAVGDPGFFHDDFGGLIARDSIMVGAEPVHVVAINRATSTITVDRNISWSADTPVTLRYRGAGPDAGAIESH